VRSRIDTYWPRLFGCALLLLLVGSAGRNATGRADAKQRTQVVALQQRSAVLTQTSHHLNFRSTAVLPAGTLAFATPAGACRGLPLAAASERLHPARSWRSDAPRPPPLSA
jgi:hypothetical protein